MAWNGYFTYDGSEFINVARTEAYVHSAGHNWFRPLFNNDALARMLDHGERYTTPLLDDAPWVDPDLPESTAFYGIYPLDVTGIEDSTRTASVVESLSDGGTPGRVRHATKGVVFSAILLAGNEAAADYGMRWLKQALLGGICGPGASGDCTGAELCYLSSAPELDDTDGHGSVAALLDGGHYVTSDTPSSESADGGDPDDTYVSEVDGGGPGSSSDSELAGGTAAATSVSDLAVDVPLMDGGSVSALGNAAFDGGTPYATGTVVEVQGFPFDFEQPEEPDLTLCLTPLQRSLRKVGFGGGPTVTAKRTTQDGSALWTVSFTATAGDPWEFSAEMPVIEGFLDPDVLVPWAGGVTPEGAAVDLDGYIHSEEACAVAVYDPIYDPLAPALSMPPTVPSIPLGHYVPPQNWRRRQFTIPRQYVPSWGEVVPKVEIHATQRDLRNLRLRFYADPYGTGDISDDPCAYCGDLVVSYVPKDHTMVLDGAERTVYVVSPGGARRPAGSLVFKTDGTPFDWPALTCGFGYIVTIDLPQTQVPPVVDLSLFARAV